MSAQALQTCAPLPSALFRRPSITTVGHAPVGRAARYPGARLQAITRAAPLRPHHTRRRVAPPLPRVRPPGSRGAPPPPCDGPRPSASAHGGSGARAPPARRPRGRPSGGRARPGRARPCPTPPHTGPPGGGPRAPGVPPHARRPSASRRRAAILVPQGPVSWPSGVRPAAPTVFWGTSTPAPRSSRRGRAPCACRAMGGQGCLTRPRLPGGLDGDRGGCLPGRRGRRRVRRRAPGSHTPSGPADRPAWVPQVHAWW
jgi:hypothetical protein